MGVGDDRADVPPLKVWSGDIFHLGAPSRREVKLDFSGPSEGSDFSVKRLGSLGITTVLTTETGTEETDKMSCEIN